MIFFQHRLLVIRLLTFHSVLRPSHDGKYMIKTQTKVWILTLSIQLLNEPSLTLLRLSGHASVDTSAGRNEGSEKDLETVHPTHHVSYVCSRLLRAHTEGSPTRFPAVLRPHINTCTAPTPFSSHSPPSCSDPTPTPSSSVSSDFIGSVSSASYPDTRSTSSSCRPSSIPINPYT